MQQNKSFIAWDGEGAVDIFGRTLPQNYVLLGNSTGERIIAERLTTDQCLAFLTEQGRKHRDAIHVAFAFDYDANMILRDLPVTRLERLRTSPTNSVYWKDYRIEYIKGKYLQITHHGKSWPEDKSDKTTIRIQDMFGFFQTSFVNAIKGYLPDHPLMADLDKVESGKSERNNFTFDKINYIASYWETEIALLEALAERLRYVLYKGGFYITDWYGPGAIASFLNRKHNIKEHMAECPSPVREAARYAYCGGRFELFSCGRFTGPIYSLDINSAYPWAITKLPSLTEGHWRYVKEVDPENLAEFGVYHIKVGGKPRNYKPGPLFYRNKNHEISFPYGAEGWYWTPEAKIAWDEDKEFRTQGLPEWVTDSIDQMQFLEGWEYVGWKTRPFSFVQEMYDTRRELKAKGDLAQMGYKLALNSIYGKTAQRVGWEHRDGPPIWHQLEWAGYITSACRARLYDVMRRIPGNQLIACETDGIYTTYSPEELGIKSSKELGGWEINEYQEMLYAQSGIYAAKDMEGKWGSKYRGLDKTTISPDDLAAHLKLMKPGVPEWPPIIGKQVRFIGFRLALQKKSMGEGKVRQFLCRWVESYKEVKIGRIGKRRHYGFLCPACMAEKSAYDMPHRLRNHTAFLEGISTPHAIPWENPEEIENVWWREESDNSEVIIP